MLVLDCIRSNYIRGSESECANLIRTPTEAEAMKKQKRHAQRVFALAPQSKSNCSLYP